MTCIIRIRKKREKGIKFRNRNREMMKIGMLIITRDRIRMDIKTAMRMLIRIGIQISWD